MRSSSVWNCLVSPCGPDAARAKISALGMIVRRFGRSGRGSAMETQLRVTMKVSPAVTASITFRNRGRCARLFRIVLRRAEVAQLGRALD